MDKNKIIFISLFVIISIGWFFGAKKLQTLNRPPAKRNPNRKKHE